MQLGFAFHQDPTYGLVMYYAPNADRAGQRRNLFLLRANDSNGDGVFGGAGDSLNQIIVNNLKAAGRGNHRLNNLQFRGDTLFLNIGTRTQNGGVDTDSRFENAGQADGGLQAGNYSSNGITSRFGEFAYTGTITFIEDVTQIGAGTNAAGFMIDDTLAAHATDTQMFTSIDPNKLRVYATGLRNVFGLAINDQGEIYVSENQNEWPESNPADRILKVESFQDDFGYQKSNGYIDSSRVKPDFHLAPAPFAGTEDAAVPNGTPVYDWRGTYRDPTGSATARALLTPAIFSKRINSTWTVMAILIWPRCAPLRLRSLNQMMVVLATQP